MKKLIITLFVMLLCKATVFCQFTLTESGFKDFSGADYRVITDSAKSAHDLFNIVLTNINNTANSGKNVVSKVDDVSISVDGSLGIDDYWTYTGKFSFEFKNGKIKVNAPKIKDIYHHSRFNNPLLKDYTTHVVINKDGVTDKDILLNSIFIYEDHKLKSEKTKELIEKAINNYLNKITAIPNDNW